MPALQGRSRELLEDKNFAHVGTVREDGSVHVIPVWVHTDDQGRVALNSAEGRDWPANARRDGRMTVTVMNMEDPYEFVSITGPVVRDTHEGADEHIDFLAKKYLDADSYPFRKPGEQRVLFVIEPERVKHYGG